MSAGLGEDYAAYPAKASGSARLGASDAARPAAGLGDDYTSRPDREYASAGVGDDDVSPRAGAKECAPGNVRLGANDAV